MVIVVVPSAVRVAYIHRGSGSFSRIAASFWSSSRNSDTAGGRGVGCSSIRNEVGTGWELGRGIGVLLTDRR
jgi:hypothetical protein